jgi:hypothetical protein
MFGSSRRTKDGQSKTHVLSAMAFFLTREGEPLQANSKGEARCRFIPTHSGFFSIKHATNKAPKHEKDRQKHLSSASPFHAFNLQRPS